MDVGVMFEPPGVEIDGGDRMDFTELRPRAARPTRGGCRPTLDGGPVWDADDAAAAQFDTNDANLLAALSKVDADGFAVDDHGVRWLTREGIDKVAASSPLTQRSCIAGCLRCWRGCPATGR
jgi:hypothetical protein